MNLSEIDEEVLKFVVYPHNQVTDLIYVGNGELQTLLELPTVEEILEEAIQLKKLKTS